MYRKNVASQVLCFQGVDASTGGIKSGVTWTVRRCIDGTFAAGGGTVTEDSTNGWYKYAMSQADTNGNDISFNFTGTGAVPQTVNILTTACDPSQVTNFGITGIPAVASGSAGAIITAGTGTAQLNVSSGNMAGSTASVVGAVGSVTGNVGGNVTGSVGSVVGAVGSVTGNVGGNVTGTVGSVVGAVGSVTGNVGGNVGGTVAGVTPATNAQVVSATGAVPAAVLAAAALVPISANIVEVNSVAIDGAGTEGNPFGPA